MLLRGKKLMEKAALITEKKQKKEEKKSCCDHKIMYGKSSLMGRCPYDTFGQN
jgi:hypothetical protein